MPRRLRYIPEDGALVEVTCRTIHSRLLLKPSPTLNDAIVGTLARAKRRYGVRICAAVFLSNHYHLLLHVDDAQQLARFMGFVNSKIAKEAGRASRWRDKIWSRRYQAIVVSNEGAAQIARLRYILSHGVKEGLVARCKGWPGLHCAEALSKGLGLMGYWFNRTKQYRAGLRGKTLAFDAYAERETLRFDPLPCWSHLPPTEHQERASGLVDSIQHHAARDHETTIRQPL